MATTPSIETEVKNLSNDPPVILKDYKKQKNTHNYFAIVIMLTFLKQTTRHVTQNLIRPLKKFKMFRIKFSEINPATKKV